MDNKKVSDSLSKTSEQRKSRRGFIKKSSVVAGVSMLPASNVWGACNVSGVSGGSQAVNTTCMVSPFTGGQSVQTWSTMNESVILDITSDIGENDLIGKTSILKTTFYYQKLRDYLNGSVVQITGNDVIPSLNMNIGAVLMEGSTASYEKKLVAAVIVNVALGFLNLPAQFHGPDGLLSFAEHLWGSLNVNYNQAVAAIEASFVGIPVTEATLASGLG